MSTNKLELQQDTVVLVEETAQCVCCGDGIPVSRRLLLAAQGYVADSRCVCQVCALLLPAALIAAPPFATLQDFIASWRKLVHDAQHGACVNVARAVLRKRGGKR